MTCRELIDFLADYREGELSPEVRTAFENHLSRCPHCRDYLQTYEQTVAMVKSLGVGDEDCQELGVPEDLIKAVLAARER